VTDTSRKRNGICQKNGIQKKRNGKRSFVSGVVILTVSNLLVKVTGLLFKIPMNYIVGDTGMGYFNSAYSIYTFFYMLSTSGLPVALAVMVSEKRAAGNITAAKTIYRTALALFAAGGLGVFLLMFFASGGLAGLIRSDKSALSVAVAAPTMLFICISSALRGYFQGCGNMVPTAVSQFIEAVGKLVIGIAAAVYAIRMGYGIHVIAAYAVSGLTLGSLAGMVYLLIAKFLRGDRDLLPDDLVIRNEPIPQREIFRRFLKISLPITVSASVMSLTNMIDTALIQRVLQHAGMAEEEAATLFGNYTSLAVPMFNLPPVFVYPIAYSIVPAVAAALSSGETKKAADAVEMSLRAAVLIGMPCALGLTVLADPVLCIFYKAESAHLASPLLTLLAPSSFFVCVLAVTNAILQSCGEERKPVISMLCGAVVKCVSNVLLLRKIGIAGAPVSTFLCYLTVTVINLAFVVKCTGIRPDFTKIFFLPAVSGLACAVTASAVNGLLMPFSGKIACFAAICTGAAVYAAILLASGNVTIDEIKTIATGAKKNRTMNRTDELKNKLKTEPKHDFSSLRELVEILRSEGGCPWDREQTHASIRADIIEETYEVIEAIDNSDPALLREELGDVMFQVMFHSRIEEEEGRFTVEEVVHDICEKMIVRHPHVFGTVEVSGTGEVLDNWDKIKKEEKSRKTARQSMEAVPKQLPTLMRVQKIAKKARKDDYDFGTDADLAAKLQSLTAKLAVTADEDEKQAILNDIIFTSAVMSRTDTEKAVGDMTDEFIKNYPDKTEE